VLEVFGFAPATSFLGTLLIITGFTSEKGLWCKLKPTEKVG